MFGFIAKVYSKIRWENLTHFTSLGARSGQQTRVHWNDSQFRQWRNSCPWRKAAGFPSGFVIESHCWTWIWPQRSHRPQKSGTGIPTAKFRRWDRKIFSRDKAQKRKTLTGFFHRQWHFRIWKSVHLRRRL